MADLHTQITEALCELRGARTIAESRPSLDNKELVELCEWRLDRLLAQQSAVNVADAVVTA